MTFCDCSYSCSCRSNINGHRDVVKLLSPYSCHVHRSHARLLETLPFDYFYRQEYEKIIKHERNEIYYDFLSRQEYEKIIKDERRSRKFAKREKRKTKTKAKKSMKSENKPGKNSQRKTINENSTRKIKHYDRKTMELLN